MRWIASWIILAVWSGAVTATTAATTPPAFPTDINSHAPGMQGNSGDGDDQSMHTQGTDSPGVGGSSTDEPLHGFNFTFPTFSSTAHLHDMSSSPPPPLSSVLFGNSFGNLSNVFCAQDSQCSAEFSKTAINARDFDADNGSEMAWPEQPFGSLPPTLVSLQIVGTGFNAPLDAFLASVPNSLLVLDLSYNRLYGTLPPLLATFTNLQVLNLAFNALYGRVPDLRALQQLALCEIALPDDTNALCCDDNGFLPPPCVLASCRADCLSQPPIASLNVSRESYHEHEPSRGSMSMMSWHGISSQATTALTNVATSVAWTSGADASSSTAIATSPSTTVTLATSAANALQTLPSATLSMMPSTTRQYVDGVPISETVTSVDGSLIGYLLANGSFVTVDSLNNNRMPSASGVVFSGAMIVAIVLGMSALLLVGCIVLAYMLHVVAKRVPRDDAGSEEQPDADRVVPNGVRKESVASRSSIVTAKKRVHVNEDDGDGERRDDNKRAARDANDVPLHALQSSVRDFAAIEDLAPPSTATSMASVVHVVQISSGDSRAPPRVLVKRRAATSQAKSKHDAHASNSSATPSLHSSSPDERSPMPLLPADRPLLPLSAQGEEASCSSSSHSSSSPSTSRAASPAPPTHAPLIYAVVSEEALAAHEPPAPRVTRARRAAERAAEAAAACAPTSPPPPEGGVPLRHDDHLDYLVGDDVRCPRGPGGEWTTRGQLTRVAFGDAATLDENWRLFVASEE